MNKRGQFLTSWVVCILLLVYCVVSNVLLIAYAENFKNEQNEKPTFNFNNTINLNSSSIVNTNENPLNFFEALFLVSFVELPALFTFFFIILPDILLGIFIYNLIRGNW